MGALEAAKELVDFVRNDLSKLQNHQLHHSPLSLDVQAVKDRHSLSPQDISVYRNRDTTWHVRFAAHLGLHDLPLCELLALYIQYKPEVGLRSALKFLQQTVLSDNSGIKMDEGDTGNRWLDYQPGTPPHDGQWRSSARLAATWICCDDSYNQLTLDDIQNCRGDNGSLANARESYQKKCLISNWDPSKIDLTAFLRKAVRGKSQNLPKACRTSLLLHTITDATVVVRQVALCDCPTCSLKAVSRFNQCVACQEFTPIRKDTSGEAREDYAFFIKGQYEEIPAYKCGDCQGWSFPPPEFSSRLPEESEFTKAEVEAARKKMRTNLSSVPCPHCNSSEWAGKPRHYYFVSVRGTVEVLQQTSARGLKVQQVFQTAPSHHNPQRSVSDSRTNRILLEAAETLLRRMDLNSLLAHKIMGTRFGSKTDREVFAEHENLFSENALGHLEENVSPLTLLETIAVLREIEVCQNALRYAVLGVGKHLGTASASSKLKSFEKTTDPKILYEGLKFIKELLENEKE